MLERIDDANKEQFQRTLLNLINIHHTHRSFLQERQDEFLSAEEWAREYCTIKIDIGRQIGKDEFIIRHCDENSLIIENNDERAKDLQEHIFDLTGKKVDCFSARQIFNPTNERRIYLGSKNYTNIFLNEPSFHKISKWDWFYNDLLIRSDVNQTFFLIGI